MNTRIKKLIRGSDSRYLTKDETREILAYTSSLPQRFKVASAVEQHENDIVGLVIEQLKPMYPKMTKFHPQGWEKGFRDVQLVLRYAVQAMILDDSSIMEEKLLYWFRTMLSGVDPTPKFVRDTYELLMESCRRHLPDDAFVLMEPFLRRVIEVMSDIPEPAVPSI